jgi:hypothetical protein
MMARQPRGGPRAGRRGHLPATARSHRETRPQAGLGSPHDTGRVARRPADDTFSFLFETIINDPIGDNQGAIDVGAIDAGSDGSNAMGLRLHYSADTPIDQAVGYILLDTDQIRARA